MVTTTAKLHSTESATRFRRGLNPLRGNSEALMEKMSVMKKISDDDLAGQTFLTKTPKFNFLFGSTLSSTIRNIEISSVM